MTLRCVKNNPLQPTIDVNINPIEQPTMAELMAAFSDQIKALQESFAGALAKQAKEIQSLREERLADNQKSTPLYPEIRNLYTKEAIESTTYTSRNSLTPSLIPTSLRIHDPLTLRSERLPDPLIYNRRRKDLSPFITRL